MVIHANAIKSLSPDDYVVIEEEHSRLQKFLSDLYNTCCNLENQRNCDSCSGEKHASCKGHLQSFFYDLLDLADKHFYHEESIMLSRPHVTVAYEYFLRHRQAHQNILRELNQLVNECASLGKQGNISQSYRHLHKTISELFEEHDRTFDDPFILSTTSP